MVSAAHGSIRARGAQTQTRILERAVHIASVEGLSSMSLATLAKATAMSKSGLFAHFRSKEALQIAILDEAERIFTEVVIRPSLLAPAGGARLTALMRAYVEYAAKSPFEGGCFFAAAGHEFDGRPGPVRDRVAGFFEMWSAQVRTALQEAIRMGQARPTTDAEQFTFDAFAVALAANMHRHFPGDPAQAAAHGRVAMQSVLDRAGVTPLPN